MKENIIKCLVALCLVLGCVTCSTNEPDKPTTPNEQVLQEISSPVDCISNVGWSWNDGIAKAGDPYSIDNHIFAFLVKASGKLSFSYGYNHNYGRIVMKIDDSDAFDEEITTSYYTSFSLSVKKGQKVTVKGYSSQIKNIKITGISDNTDNPDNSNNPWDF